MRKPIRKKPLAWVDVETTGLDPQKQDLLEISIVFDLDDALRNEIPWVSFLNDFAHFTTRVKPEKDPETWEVNHHIATSPAWGAAPVFKDISKRVEEILKKDLVLCGHNVGFDIAFLQQALSSSGSDFVIHKHKIDTVTLAWEHLAPCGLDSLSLDSIRDFLGWDKTDAHTALKDALDARRLQKLLTRASRLDRLRWKMRGRFG